MVVVGDEVREENKLKKDFVILKNHRASWNQANLLSQS